MAAGKGRPAAFVAVGCMAAATHFVAVFVLVSCINVAPALANVPAFLCAFCVSHAGHGRFSFSSHGGAARSRWRWLQVSLAMFLLNQGLTMLALHAFPQLWYLLVIAIVSAIVAGISYGLGKAWAFAA